MNVSLKMLTLVLILGVAGCGPTAKTEAQQTDSTKAAAAPPAAPSPRSLKLAHELAASLDLNNPLVGMLWVDIGQWEAKSGDVEAVRRMKQQLDREKGILAIIASAKITTSLARALTARNELAEAEQIVKAIPEYQAEERCQGFAEIAAACVIRGDAASAPRFWGLAEQCVTQEQDRERRISMTLDLIRCLAKAEQIDQSRKLAASLEARDEDQRGWGPVAEHLMLHGDQTSAETIILAKLNGANTELYQLIVAVVPKGEFIAARSALGQMDDPVLASMASHKLAVAMARRGYKDLATLQLRDSWSYMDNGNLNLSAKGQIFASSIDPTTILAGIAKTLVVCQELEQSFPAEVAADAYQRLARNCPPHAKDDASRHLSTAERLAEKVSDPVAQISCYQWIYRTRSQLFGEDPAIEAAEKVTSKLNRGYALLGVVDGQLDPEK